MGPKRFRPSVFPGLGSGRAFDVALCVTCSPLFASSLTKQSPNVSPRHSGHQCKPLMTLAFARAIAPAETAGGPVWPYVRGASRRPRRAPTETALAARLFHKSTTLAVCSTTLQVSPCRWPRRQTDALKTPARRRTLRPLTSDIVHLVLDSVGWSHGQACLPVAAPSFIPRTSRIASDPRWVSDW